MTPDDVSIEVRDNLTLRRHAVIEPQFMDLKVIRRHLKRSAWTVRLPVEHEAVQYLAQPGYGIVVRLRNRERPWLSGPMTGPTRRRSPEDPQGLMTFTGESDDVILWEETTLPDPAHLPSAQTLSHDVRTGLAEAVMKAYVNANVGPGALMSRRVPLARKLLIAADQGRGLSVSKSARFDMLGDLLAEIGRYSRLGFEVVQIGNNLEFETYSIRDRSRFVRFDIENGTLENEEVKISPPKITRAIVLGQGDGAARQVVTRDTTASLAAEEEWGWGSTVVRDQRQTSDVDELQQAGDELLEDGGFTQTAAKVVPADDTTMEFITEWDLGDDVTVVIDGIERVTNITEVALLVNKDAAMVGAAIGDVTGFESDAILERKVRDQERRIAALERLISG